MKISILTVFPELLDSLFKSTVVARAIRQGIAELEIVDIKDFAGGCFRHIDDSPYGGTPGMIIRYDVLSKALDSVYRPGSHSVLLSPKGKVYNQEKAHFFSELEHLILVCGHFEGTDARFDSDVDELVSLGDFILTGGECAAAVIADSVIRLLNNVLKDGVTADESHENGLLEHPQYTHPYEYNGKKVPDILLSGDRAKIKEWKHRQALSETMKYRPDMAEKYLKNL